jgi:hypothetical protein
LEGKLNHVGRNADRAYYRNIGLVDRLNGMRITEEQERMVYDAIREGAAYAEEIAKRETMTGPEKLALASRHASNVLKQVGVKRDVSALSPRIESALSDVRARESRLSMPPEFK